jgi:glycosyltransferase involved in cell wall biosynthesis
VLAGTIETILDSYPHVEFAMTDIGGSPFRPHERIRSLPFVTIEQYPSVLARFDIGVIPLVDRRFNRCKSDLKFLEYSMMGIPSVVSKLVPYETAVQHGANGFLAGNPKDWLKSLRRLIEDPGLRDEMGGRARLFAESRTVERNVGNWERAYGIGE